MSIEIDWAIQQLVGIGLADQKVESGELCIGLTPRGHEHCETIINGLTTMDRICLLLYFNHKKLNEVEGY